MNIDARISRNVSMDSERVNLDGGRVDVDVKDSARLNMDSARIGKIESARVNMDSKGLRLRLLFIFTLRLSSATHVYP